MGVAIAVGVGTHLHAELTLLELFWQPPIRYAGTWGISAAAAAVASQLEQNLVTDEAYLGSSRLRRQLS